MDDSHEHKAWSSGGFSARGTTLTYSFPSKILNVRDEWMYLPLTSSHEKVVIPNGSSECLPKPKYSTGSCFYKHIFRRKGRNLSSSHWLSTDLIVVENGVELTCPSSAFVPYITSVSFLLNLSTFQNNMFLKQTKVNTCTIFASTSLIVCGIWKEVY